MKKKEVTRLAQDLIMQHLSGIGYGDDFSKFLEEVGNEDLAYVVIKRQMDRIAKIMGFTDSWFS